MRKLEYVGACEAEYWDEKGPHLIDPGDPPVSFTLAMAKIREAEPCWQKPEPKPKPKPKPLVKKAKEKKGGE